MTGGASGALEGALIAGRGAALAAKVAEAAEAGGTVARVAEGGLQAARAGGAAIRGARMALGATKAGATVAKAGPVLNPLLTGIGVANFGDQAQKFARGKGSAKDLALSTLGLLPLGGKITGALARRGAAKVESQALETAATKLSAVESKTIAARASANEAARLAPTADATEAAASASKTIEGTAGTARDVREGAVARIHEVGPTGEAAVVRDLRGKVAAVEERTAAALDDVRSARTALPGEADVVAGSAEEQLAAAQRLAQETHQQIAAAADKASLLEGRANVAARAEQATGTTASAAGFANAWHNIETSRKGQASNYDKAALPRIALGMFLGRNARGPVTAGK
jgi:hypothetical protein